MQRHTEIVARVRAEGTVSVADHSTVLDVSASTIRRDLHHLDRAGVLHDDAVELILLGGLVRRSYHSLVGVLTEDAVGQVGVDRAFLGTSGIGPAGQVMHTTFVEVPVKRALIAAAAEVVVVADGHKIPGAGTMRVCVGDDVDVLVTTTEADPAILEQFRAHGVEVVLA